MRENCHREILELICEEAVGSEGKISDRDVYPNELQDDSTHEKRLVCFHRCAYVHHEHSVDAETAVEQSEKVEWKDEYRDFYLLTLHYPILDSFQNLGRRASIGEVLLGQDFVLLAVLGQ